MKNFIIGTIIIGIAIIAGCMLVKPAVINYGASGTAHYNLEYFYKGLVQGGGVYTAPVASSTTWTAKHICDNSMIVWAPDTATVNTTTLPSAAALINDCLQEIGDYKDIVFYNHASTSAGTVRFTEGTYLTIYTDSGTTTEILNGANVSNIRFLRDTATTVMMIINEAVPL